MSEKVTDGESLLTKTIPVPAREIQQLTNNPQPTDYSLYLVSDWLEIPISLPRTRLTASTVFQPLHSPEWLVTADFPSAAKMNRQHAPPTT
jgi:hypothetical protein